jgi:hypothetical protein
MIIQPGDFCCVPISGNVGKLISFGEWLDGDGFTDYDHAEIFIDEADTKGPFGYTIGAYPGGAAKIALPCPPAELPNALWSSNSFILTSEERLSIVASAAKLLGTPYSALDYFALVLHRFGLNADLVRDYIASTGHMICSQLVDYTYFQSGVHLFSDNRWFGYVTPADLANVIKEKLVDGK